MSDSPTRMMSTLEALLWRPDAPKGLFERFHVIQASLANRNVLESGQAEQEWRRLAGEAGWEWSSTADHWVPIPPPTIADAAAKAAKNDRVLREAIRVFEDRLIDRGEATRSFDNYLAFPLGGGGIIRYESALRDLLARHNYEWNADTNELTKTWRGRHERKVRLLSRIIVLSLAF